MNDHPLSQPTFNDENDATGGLKTSCRSVIGAGAPRPARMALGTAYQKPGMISVRLQEVNTFAHEVITQQVTPQKHLASRAKV